MPKLNHFLTEGTQMRDFLLDLKRSVNQLPKKQAALARYILENPEEAKSINLKDICQKCNTTEPVVFAFCRKLLLNSFTDLKTNIAISLGANSVKQTKIKDIEVFDEDLLTLKANAQILDFLKEHYELSLKETFESLSKESFEKAVGILSKANRIVLLGVGTSGNVGHLILQNFLRSGKAVNWINDPNLFVTYVVSLKKTDVCVILSQVGNQKDIEYAVSVCKEVGVQIIIVTSNPSPFFSENSDALLLTCPAPLTASVHISLVSNLALPILYVADALAIALLRTFSKDFIQRAKVSTKLNNLRVTNRPKIEQQ